MVEERIINILKRMTFQYFVISDIDNTKDTMVSVQVFNTVTETKHTILFPYDMLERWYSYNNLKYDLVKEYILTNISEDYHSHMEDLYGRWKNNK